MVEIDLATSDHLSEGSLNQHLASVVENLFVGPQYSPGSAWRRRHVLYVSKCAMSERLRCKGEEKDGRRTYPHLL